MKHVISVIAISVLTLIFFACQKETASSILNQTATNKKIGQRSSDEEVLYAVSISPGSQILTIDASTLDLLGTTPLTGFNAEGDQVVIEDIKGITFMLGDYYVTTGSGNDTYFKNSLLKIDPTTGTVIQHVLSLGVAVSDICFLDQSFENAGEPIYGLVGLADNSNNLIWIQYLDGVFSADTPIPVTGIEDGFRASGLTWARSICGEPKLLVSTTAPNVDECRLYAVEPVSGVSTLEWTISGPEFGGAHVAFGWFRDSDHFIIGHNSLNGHHISVYSASIRTEGGLIITIDDVYRNNISGIVVIEDIFMYSGSFGNIE